MDKYLFERGANCTWMDERVDEMSRDRLIEFIGQLDWVIGECAAGRLPEKTGEA